MVSLGFWYMLPVAVLIATTAMASGVEGATFFSPLFIVDTLVSKLRDVPTPDRRTPKELGTPPAGRARQGPEG